MKPHSEYRGGVVQRPTYPLRDYSDQLWLVTKFPCCRGRAKFKCVALVPREVYDRTCSRCGQRWEVERRVAKVLEDRRIDILEWVKVSR